MCGINIELSVSYGGNRPQALDLIWIMKSSKLSLVLLTLALLTPSVAAQEIAKPTPSFRYDDTGDKEKIRLFLSKVDEEITRLIDAYPQLADWKEELEVTDQQIRGKKITGDELSYWHSGTKAKSPNYRDWYGENGCQISIRVYTEFWMNRLQGAGIKTRIFGLKMGDRYIVATVITEKPEVPELEKKITEIIRRQASEVGEHWGK